MGSHEEAVAAMILGRFATWLLDDLDISLTAEHGVPPDQCREWLDKRAAVWLSTRHMLGIELLKDLREWRS